MYTHTHTFLSFCTQSAARLSFFCFHHDDMVAVDCFHWRICVDGVINSAVLQLKGCFLKGAHHAASGHPAKVTLEQPWVLSAVSGHLSMNHTFKLISFNMSSISKLNERERERALNLKTLFYKDCSLGSVKNLSNNQSLLSY